MRTVIAMCAAFLFMVGTAQASGPEECLESNNPNAERRVGHWGYCHRYLHEKGIVDEVTEGSRPKSCCSGIHSGECRVAIINLHNRTTKINGLTCPIPPHVKIVAVQGPLPYGYGVVCAGHGGLYGNTCPTTYCVGASTGG